MNEEPKSIWKKSWTGRAWLWAWLILVLATFLIVVIVSLFIPGRLRDVSVWEAALNASIGFGVIGGVCVGILVFIRWLCCWRNFKKFLFGLACFATMVALLYAEEDWRGWHAWNQFKHEWEAKGEKFDWQSIVPPPVPDDQNFAFSPVWIAEERYNFLDTPKRAEAWYGNRIYSEEISKILPLFPVSVSGLVGKNNWSVEYSPNFPKVSGQWATASLTDLKPWQAYYRGTEESNRMAEIPVAPQPQSPAADVLLALSKFDPVIEQLRQDSARPYSRFPLGYDDEDKATILLPHLAVVKRYSRVLQLRAIAELQNNESDKALADVKLALRLVDSIRTEPVLISHLLRIAMLQLTLQPIYEGLAEHKWSDAQLTELDDALAKLNFVVDYSLAIHGEMGFQNGAFDYLRRYPVRFTNMSGAGDNNPLLPAQMFIHLIPNGWFYQNQVRCGRIMVLNLPIADIKQQTVSPAALRRAESASGAEEAKFRHFSPYNFLERLLLPALSSVVKKFAYAQVSVDLARGAIALERYRLAHGEYPESLDALAPKFIEKIPHDVIGGEPLHYRRTSDGQFVLYSVGWNEKDDGGVVVLTKGSTPTVDINQGDWGWRYPQK
jgi:hypothetical protein